MQSQQHTTSKHQHQVIPAMVLMVLVFNICCLNVSFANINEDASPNLLLVDEDVLGQVKRLLLKPNYTFLRAHLLGISDAYADSPPLSVTQNRALAISGNPRDYFSVGPYWWPDPEKTDGLPWINKDGEVNRAVRGPSSDSKLFDAMAIRLHTLAIAYYISADERYAKAAEAQLNTWFLDPEFGMTPHLKYAQGIPGRTNGRGIGIIEFRKITAVLDAIALLNRTLSSQTKEGLDMWFSIFLGWLIESKNGQEEAQMHNNHGTFYDLIVTALSLHLHMNEVAELTLNSSRERALKQIDETGAQAHELKRTRPFHYSVFNLYAFAALSKMASNTNTDVFKQGSREHRRLKKAHDYLFDNLLTSAIWPGSQESALAVDSLVDSSLLLQQTYPDIRFSIDQISAFEKAQVRLAACQFWMNAEVALLKQLTPLVNQKNRFDITRCDFLH